MKFSKKVSEEALTSCGRCCCICHKFCGTKIELHHITQISESGLNSFDNCIPLCFDCHADIKSYNPNHPKGKKYTESEIKKHRDNCYKKIKENPTLGESNSKYALQDSKVLKRFISLFSEYNLISFVRNNYFIVGSFQDEIFLQITKIKNICELPESEFMDSDLEKLRIDLNKSIDKLDSCITKNTFGASPGRQAIPNEWEDERYYKASDLFEEITKELTSTYDNLIRAARRKLLLD